MAFSPPSWVLPRQAEACAKAMHHAKRSTCYIVKPEDGAKGDGIFLVTDWNDYLAKCTARAASGKTFVVQAWQ